MHRKEKLKKRSKRLNKSGAFKKWWEPLGNESLRSLKNQQRETKKNAENLELGGKEGSVLGKKPGFLK